MKITKKQARMFILFKQGLYGDYKFEEEEGIYNYIKQVGCIQFDPIDVCGKNHELVLQSRVKNFSPESLYKLLYEDRKFIDYWDKNMSIFPIEDWPFFERNRERARVSGRSREKIEQAAGDIRNIIEEKGSVSSNDIKFNEIVDWSWAPTSLSRATLETMYFQGELIIHHKKNTKKYYDFAYRYIPADILNSQDPNITDNQYYDWYILRRIGSVGLLWNKASDAYLGIHGFKAKERISAFKRLLDTDKIMPIYVEDIKDPLYMKKEDMQYFEIATNNKEESNRTELIAPLDNLMWDRKLIKELFNFEYKWEIYTPVNERKYGYYVLPLLDEDKFVGRVEIVKNKIAKTLTVRNLWWEEDIKLTTILIENVEKCLLRFGQYHNSSLIYQFDIKKFRG